MADEKDMFYVDSEVALQVLQIFDEAEEYAIVVSPWLDLWGHVRNAITRAQSRGLTDIYVFIRKEGETSATQRSSLAWLLRRNVRIFEVDRLHAKIYFNEKTVLLSSMNLMESSALNSVEFAYSIKDAITQLFIRRWVTEDVMQIASEIGNASSKSEGASQGTITVDVLETAIKQVGEASSGFCIKCRRTIDLDPMEPLCDGCDAQMPKDPPSFEYEDGYCHSCGQVSLIAWYAPLCDTCDKERIVTYQKHKP